MYEPRNPGACFAPISRSGQRARAVAIVLTLAITALVWSTESHRGPGEIERDPVADVLAAARVAGTVAAQPIMVWDVPRAPDEVGEDALLAWLARHERRRGPSRRAVAEALERLEGGDFERLIAELRGTPAGVRAAILEALESCSSDTVVAFCRHATEMRWSREEDVLLSLVVSGKGEALPFEFVRRLTRSGDATVVGNAVSALARTDDVRAAVICMTELRAHGLDGRGQANLDITARCLGATLTSEHRSGLLRECRGDAEAVGWIREQFEIGARYARAYKRIGRLR